MLVYIAVSIDANIEGYDHHYQQLTAEAKMRLWWGLQRGYERSECSSVWRESWGFEAINRVVGKLKQDLALMDLSNGEEQVRSRSMNQQGHLMIWSGSYHLLIKFGVCVASILEEMERNAQGKGITYRTFYFTSHRCVEKFMTGFRIDSCSINRGNLLVATVI
jgi:hypothetical protein